MSQLYLTKPTLKECSRPAFQEVGRVYGCGALNWDLFYEIPELAQLRELFSGDFEVWPGGEVALCRDKFLRVLERVEGFGKRVYACGGGSAANTIYALAKLGIKCGFFGAVGEDEFGKEVLSELSSIGVELSHVVREGETSLALILLDSARDRFIIVSPGTAERALASEEYVEKVKKTLLEEGSFFLHLSSLASQEGQAFQHQLVEALAEEKEKRKIFLSLDPGQIYAEKGLSFLSFFLARVDLLFMTEGELASLGLSPRDLFSGPLNFNLFALFLKMGKKGAKVITKDLELLEEAKEIKLVVDNTGAGDYFNAGVIACLLQGGDLATALRSGNELASLSLKDYGRRPFLS